MPHQGLAVVTGASSGIGAVFARRLAARGHPLLLVARRIERLDALAAELAAAHGVEARAWPADLGDAADLARLEERLSADPVAMLVNNAGAGGLGPTAATGADAQERLIALNVTALVRLSLAALTGFRRTGAGTLVNLASILSLGATAGGATYSGTKAFVLNFTRSLQEEYAGSPIRIQAVLPGPVRTEFFSSQGMSDGVFADSAFVTADALVDAALAGLDSGEAITIPTLRDMAVWDELERARGAFLRQTMSGQVADRYRGG